MTASVDIWLVKARHVFNSECETGVVGLAQDVINQALLSKVVHDPRGEIALEASRRWNVDLEVWVGEGTIHDAAATSMAGDVERILVRGCFNVRSVSSKPVFGIEDGSLKDGGAFVIRR